MNLDEMVRHLEFEYYGISAANPDWDMSLRDFLISRGLTEKIIAIDTQSAWDYWKENICPWKLDVIDDARTADDAWEYFDRWIDWLVGTTCFEGNDAEYYYLLHKPEEQAKRLDQFGIQYEIRGNDLLEEE